MFFAVVARLSVPLETVRSHCCSELSALAYELAHELGVSHLCTVRVAYMVYPAWLRSALRCWLVCIGYSVMEGGIILFNDLPALPNPRKVEAGCKLLHLCFGSLV